MIDIYVSDCKIWCNRDYKIAKCDYDNEKDTGIPVLSDTDLIYKFFDFYSTFDYRYDIASPYLGKVVKKRAFVENLLGMYEDSAGLAEEDYFSYEQDFANLESLRIDAPMCVQDPFNLHLNLTRNVSKVNLNRFRTTCSNANALLLRWRRVRILTMVKNCHEKKIILIFFFFLYYSMMNSSFSIFSLRFSVILLIRVVY